MEPTAYPPSDPPDDWDLLYLELGYIYCSPHGDWHRPPECPIDEDGNPNPVWEDED